MTIERIKKYLEKYGAPEFAGLEAELINNIRTGLETCYPTLPEAERDDINKKNWETDGYNKIPEIVQKENFVVNVLGNFIWDISRHLLKAKKITDLQDFLADLTDQEKEDVLINEDEFKIDMGITRIENYLTTYKEFVMLRLSLFLKVEQVLGDYITGETLTEANWRGKFDNIANENNKKKAVEEIEKKFAVVIPGCFLDNRKLEELENYIKYSNDNEKGVYDNNIFKFNLEVLRESNKNKNMDIAEIIKIKIWI